MASTLIPRVGAFGEYGGRFVPELLVPALDELEHARKEIVPSREFKKALAELLAEWAGRPTPLANAPRFSEACELDVVMKREDLLHGGAHKTNNVTGQALMAKFMGKLSLGTPGIMRVTWGSESFSSAMSRQKKPLSNMKERPSWPTR